MRSNKVSLKRRQIMIAGVAATAVPAFAGQLRETAVSALEADGGLVVSGRILARNGRPLAGAAVEIWRADARAEAARATTDGDGRFFAKVSAAGRPRQLHYRVSDGGRTLAREDLYFARGRAVAEGRAGHLQRDEAGIWRAAFGLSLA